MSGSPSLDVEPLPLPERGLRGHLDQVRGVGRRLARAAVRIGTGDIEVAQDDVREAVRGRRVGIIHSLMSLERP